MAVFESPTDALSIKLTNCTGAIPDSELTSGEPTMPRLNANGTVSAPTGVCRFAMFTARKTETVTQIRTITGAAAASGVTLCRIGVYSVDAADNLTLVASTTNDTSLWIATTTVYTKALTAGFSKVRGTRYAVGLLFVGSGAPTWVGNSTLLASEGAIVPRLNASVSGLSDLPSSELVGSLSSSPNMPYAVLLP